MEENSQKPKVISLSAKKQERKQVDTYEGHPIYMQFVFDSKGRRYGIQYGYEFTHVQPGIFGPSSECKHWDPIISYVMPMVRWWERPFTDDNHRIESLKMKAHRKWLKWKKEGDKLKELNRLATGEEPKFLKENERLEDENKS